MKLYINKKLFIAIALIILFSPTFIFANEQLIEMANDDAQWAMPTKDYANTRFSKLSQINDKNAENLQVAWTFSTGALRGHEGSPLVIGDMMYLVTPFPNMVYALDLNNDARIVWKYEPKPAPESQHQACCDLINRGVAYGDGKIFATQLDGHLSALDAKTGREVWKTTVVDYKTGATITAAPMVIKDKVLCGISGGEYGVQAFLAAFDIHTGKMLWQGYSVGSDKQTLILPGQTTSMGKKLGKDTGLTTWKKDQWKNGGGGAWAWISYDPELNLIYYGSGNPGPWNSKQRPGDNKWTSSVFARDLDTGLAKWIYQFTPHDEWDFDGNNENYLIDKEIKGKMRKVLVHFDRNGFVYTLDRKTGELISAYKYDPIVNWAKEINLKTGVPVRDKKYSPERGGTKGICPSSMGSKDLPPGAYSPLTGFVYLDKQHTCMNNNPYQTDFKQGELYVGSKLEIYPAPGSTNMGTFTAWDTKKNKIAWENKEPFAGWSGVLATAGNVVFYGTLEGYFKAVHAKTGKELYKFKTPSGIVGNVMTYMHKGKQYVAVFSGIGGWAGIAVADPTLTNDWDGLGAVGAYKILKSYTNQGGTLMVFSLPGKEGKARN
jgi:PQQ-dependent dehydrogenase (methanol/ethanol family)